MADDRRYPERDRRPPARAPGDMAIPIVMRAGSLRLQPPPPAPANVPAEVVTMPQVVSPSKPEDARYHVGVSFSFTLITLRKLIKYAEYMG